MSWSLARTITGDFFSELFRSNVLLSASARRHSARQFRGPLSIKGVVRGEAVWTVEGREYRVDETSCLIVSREEPYDLEVRSTDPVETFVVFFLIGKAFLDDALFQPFDLGLAARYACLSPHHFHRSFRAVLERTPFGYVTQRRIAQAKRLLKEKDWPVAEICESLGYQSLPSFTRLFRKQVSMTPAAFRERAAGE